MTCSKCEMDVEETNRIETHKGTMDLCFICMDYYVEFVLKMFPKIYKKLTHEQKEELKKEADNGK